MKDYVQAHWALIYDASIWTFWLIFYQRQEWSNYKQNKLLYFIFVETKLQLKRFFVEKKLEPKTIHISDDLFQI